MEQASAPKSVAQALSSVAAWRADAQGVSDSALADTRTEIENLETAIQNLQQQLEALKTSQQELVEKSTNLAKQELAKTYEAIRDALQDQVAAVRVRAEAMKVAEGARKDAIAKAMDTPEAQDLKAKYDNFVTVVEPALAGMDEMFRAPMLAQRKAIVDGLDAIVAKADPGPVNFEGSTLELDVVYSIDAPEGKAEIVMVVLPLPEEAKETWQDGPEDVIGQIAARASQVVYQACKTVGAGEVHAVVGGHQGRLAIEVELPGVEPSALQSAMQSGFDEIFSDVPELKSAKIAVKAQFALVDHLLPPEEDEA